METFAERLFRLRNEKRLTQEAAAEAIGVSRVALTRYENGQRMPKMNIVDSMAKVYGVTVDYLMGREEPPKEAPTPRDERRAQMEEILLRMPQDKYDQALAILEVLAAEQKKEG